MTAVSSSPSRIDLKMPSMVEDTESTSEPRVLRHRGSVGGVGVVVVKSACKKSWRCVALRSVALRGGGLQCQDIMRSGFKQVRYWAYTARSGFNEVGFNEVGFNDVGFNEVGFCEVGGDE